MLVTSTVVIKNEERGKKEQPPLIEPEDDYLLAETDYNESSDIPVTSEDNGELDSIIDSIRSSDEIELRRVDVYGGHYHAIFYDDEYLYTAHNQGLSIFTVSGESTLEEVGFLNSQANYHDIVVNNGYAYIAAFYYGLVVVDVSNPTEPREIGRCNADGNSESIAMEGNHAYIAARHSGLVVVDVSDPMNPQYACGFDTDGDTYDVEVVGNYAYMADAGNGLVVVDVSNPENPQYAGNYDTDGYAKAVAVSDNHAYIADDSNGLVVVDVSDPTDPQYVGNYSTEHSVIDVAVNGDYAYIRNLKSLVVLNVSEPGSPQYSGNYDTIGEAEKVTVNDYYAYVANGPFGFDVIDITDPSNPQRAWSYITPIHATEVVVRGIYAYFADYIGLTIFDVSDPTDPQYTGFYGTARSVCDVAVSGNSAYLAVSDFGLVIVDVSDPKNPKKTGEYEAMSFIDEVEVSGNYAYVSDYHNGLIVVDVSNPENPQTAGHYDTYGIDCATISGDFIYIMDYIGFTVVDVSNPTNPQYAGEVKSVSGVDIAVSNDYAYIIYDRRDLSVVDVSDPTDPQYTGYLEINAFEMASLAVIGNYLFITDGEGDSIVVDVSNPAEPLEVGDYENSAMGVTLDGEYLYVTIYGGFEIIEIIDPTNTVPSEPQNLYTHSGDNYIELFWAPPEKDGGSEITTYNIYRSKLAGLYDGNPYATLGNVIQYVDINVNYGETYDYKVAAINKNGEGDLSEEVSVTQGEKFFVPSAPLNLHAKHEENQITIQWDPPRLDGGVVIQQYQIHRNYEPDVISSIPYYIVAGGADSYIDDNIELGETYYYYVTAVNSEGLSNPSNEVRITIRSGNDFDALKNTIKSAIGGNTFELIRNFDEETKNQLRIYAEDICEENGMNNAETPIINNQYIIQLEEKLFLPIVFILQEPTIIDERSVGFIEMNSNRLVLEKDEYVHLLWLSNLAVSAFIDDPDIGQYVNDMRIRNYLADAEWAEDMFERETDYGLGFNLGAIFQTMIVIAATGGLVGGSGLAGLTAGGLPSVASALSLFSKLISIADVTYLTLQGQATIYGDIHNDLEFAEGLNNFASSENAETGRELGRHANYLSAGINLRKVYLGYKTIKDLIAANDYKWMNDAYNYLEANPNNAGFLTSALEDAYKTLHKTDFLVGVLSTILGTISVDTREQARVNYLNAIDFSCIAEIDTLLGTEILPKFKDGTASEEDVANYYQYNTLRELILASIYDRSANQVEDSLWGEFAGISYPKLITHIGSWIGKTLTGGPSIEEYVEALRESSRKNKENAQYYSSISSPNGAALAWEWFYNKEFRIYASSQWPLALLSRSQEDLVVNITIRNHEVRNRTFKIGLSLIKYGEVHPEVYSSDYTLDSISIDLGPLESITVQRPMNIPEENDTGLYQLTVDCWDAESRNDIPNGMTFAYPDNLGRSNVLLRGNLSLAIVTPSANEPIEVGSPTTPRSFFTTTANISDAETGNSIVGVTKENFEAYVDSQITNIKTVIFNSETGLYTLVISTPPVSEGGVHDLTLFVLISNSKEGSVTNDNCIFYHRTFEELTPTLISPSNGASFEVGQELTVSHTESNSSLVVSEIYYYDEGAGPTIIEDDNPEPGIQWNTSSIKRGTYVDTWVMITNESGSIGTSNINTIFFIPNVVGESITGRPVLWNITTKIKENETHYYPLVIDSTISTWTLGCVIMESELDLTLYDPYGYRINETNVKNVTNIAFVKNAIYQGFTITNASAGEWLIVVTRIGIGNHEPYSIFLVAETRLSLSIMMDKPIYNISEPVKIIAGIGTPSSTFTSAYMRATITNETGNTTQIQLYDDGAHDDGMAIDGVFTNYFLKTDIPGTYTLTVLAEGIFDGYPFIRQYQTTIHVNGTATQSLLQTQKNEYNISTRQGDTHTTSIIFLPPIIPIEAVLTVSDFSSEDSVIPSSQCILDRKMLFFNSNKTASVNMTIQRPETALPGTYSGFLIVTTNNSLLIPLTIIVSSFQAIQTPPFLEMEIPVSTSAVMSVRLNLSGTGGLDNLIPFIDGDVMEWSNYELDSAFIEENGSVFLNLTYTPPIDTEAGWFYGSLYLLAENHTFSPIPIALNITRKPDLIVTPENISLSAENIIEGNRVIINATITNVGVEGVTNATVAIFVNEEIVGVVNVTIDSFSQEVVSLSWIAAAGIVNITIQIDPTNAFAEIREDNNLANREVIVKTKSDLHIHDIIVTEKIVDGDTTTIEVVLENSGRVDAEMVSLTLSIDGEHQEMKTVNLTGLSTTSIFFEWEASTGIHIIRVVVDASDTIDESNETNNEKNTTIEVLSREEPHDYEFIFTSFVIIIVIGGLILIGQKYGRKKRKRSIAGSRDQEKSTDNQQGHGLGSGKESGEDKWKAPVEDELIPDNDIKTEILNTDRDNSDDNDVIITDEEVPKSENDDDDEIQIPDENMSRSSNQDFHSLKGEDAYHRVSGKDRDPIDEDTKVPLKNIPSEDLLPIETRDGAFEDIGIPKDEHDEEI